MGLIERMKMRHRDAALRRVRAVLENGYTKWFPNGRPRLVLAVASVDNNVYAKLPSGKWSCTQLCYGSKVDHFVMSAPELKRIYGFGKKQRGNAAKAVKGLVALGLVSKEDGEVARMHFIDIYHDKDERETREDLKRRARRLGYKLVETRR